MATQARAENSLVSYTTLAHCLGKSWHFEAASAWIHHLGVSIKCIGVIGAILNRQTLRNRHHKPAPQQQPWPH